MLDADFKKAFPRKSEAPRPFPVDRQRDE